MSSNQDFILEILEDSGLATRRDIQEARDSSPNGNVLETLIASGVVTEEDSMRALAAHAAMEFIELETMTLDRAVLDRVPKELAERFKVVPVAETDGGLMIAVSNPLDFDTFDSLGHVLGITPEFVCATSKAITAALKNYYGIDSEQPATVNPY